MNFVKAMEIAEAGFDAWAAKEHNAKWVRRIGGTPIKNDLLVNIAEAIVRLSPSEAQLYKAGIVERMSEYSSGEAEKH